MAARTARGSLAAGRDLPDPPIDGPGPFGLADPHKVGRVLGEAGFAEIELAEMDEPFDLGRDAADAFAFAPNIGMVSGLLTDLDDATRSDALESLRSALAAHEQPDGVLLASACWLVTATRH